MTQGTARTTEPNATQAVPTDFCTRTVPATHTAAAQQRLRQGTPSTWGADPNPQRQTKPGPPNRHSPCRFEIHEQPRSRVRHSTRGPPATSIEDPVDSSPEGSSPRLGSGTTARTRTRSTWGPSMSARPPRWQRMAVARGSAASSTRAGCLRTPSAGWAREAATHFQRCGKQRNIQTRIPRTAHPGTLACAYPPGHPPRRQHEQLPDK